MAETVIDLDQLKLMTGGDAELAAEALGIFRSQADLWGRLLDASGPVREWADACHTIKGAARSVGLMALGDACARGEALGRAGAPGRTETAVVLCDVKDRLGEAVEAIAVLQHRLLMAQDFDALHPESGLPLRVA